MGIHLQPCAVPLDAQTLFFGARNVLLLLHAASAIVLIGSSAHHTLRMPSFLRGHGALRLERLYARVLATAYASTYLLGAILYPTYRYHVRALFLDRYHPLVSNLFDIKENMATIALLLAVSIGVLGGRFTNEPEDRPVVRVYAGMSLFVTATVWFNVLSGLYIVSVRSV